MLLPTACGKETLVDDDVAERLGQRSLSIGSHGYVQFWNGHTVILLHRWIAGLQIGDRITVDHINRDRLDNRKENLRVVSQMENNQNKPRVNAYQNHSGRWQAKMNIYGETHYLGTYDTKEEAMAIAADYRADQGLAP